MAENPFKQFNFKKMSKKDRLALLGVFEAAEAQRKKCEAAAERLQATIKRIRG